MNHRLLICACAIFPAGFDQNSHTPEYHGSSSSSSPSSFSLSHCHKLVFAKSCQIHLTPSSSLPLLTSSLFFGVPAPSLSAPLRRRTSKDWGPDTSAQRTSPARACPKRERPRRTEPVENHNSHFGLFKLPIYICVCIYIIINYIYIHMFL